MNSRNKTALIIGATSGIAMAVCQKLAEEHHHLFLVARNPQRLMQLKDDLVAKYSIKVETLVMDGVAVEQQQQMLDQATKTLGHIDIALIAYGVLPTIPVEEQTIAYVASQFEVNGSSTVALLAMLRPVFDKQKFGSIAVISSVAGDRGRRSNFLYGSAKAAVTAYASGLRAYFSDKGVNVLTIKPGFVDTAMTAHVASKGMLWASPNKVATDIVTAIYKRKAVVYTPVFWWPIMFIIKHLPESIFKRLNI